MAQDTEFPGVCYPGADESTNIFEYNILKNNVDKLKIIQLGITLCTPDGEVVEDCPTWQFNFQFDPKLSFDEGFICRSDESNKGSLDLLVNSGFDFAEHCACGIDPVHFSELLTMSGLVLNDKIRWISFHGDYDFAYLIKLLTGQKLPEKKEEVDRILRIFFPHVFDVKYMLKDFNFVNYGLNKLADQLNVRKRCGREV